MCGDALLQCRCSEQRWPAAGLLERAAGASPTRSVRQQRQGCNGGIDAESDQEARMLRRYPWLGAKRAVRSKRLGGVRPSQDQQQLDAHSRRGCEFVQRLRT